MSSYILSIESITDIAESIRYILDNSSNSNCISLNTKELKNQFRNCDGKSGFYQTRKIARVLYRFNDLAVSSRYDESATEIPDFPNDGKNLYMLDRYRFIKKLECYLYQCDDVTALISGKEYRRTAFSNYLQHENYISPIIKACYR